MGKEKNLKPLLKKFSLSLSDYPMVTENFQKKYLKYVLNSDGWMRCEELFFDAKDYLELLIEELWMKYSYSEAFSIAKRNNMTKTLRNTEIIALFEQMETEKFDDIKNEIFESDNFAPTEENLTNFKLGSFLNFNFFGKSKKDVIFVDSVEAGFEEFKNELMNAKTVKFYILLFIYFIL